MRKLNLNLSFLQYDIIFFNSSEAKYKCVKWPYNASMRDYTHQSFWDNAPGLIGFLTLLP